jgi:hypothetical protein
VSVAHVDDMAVRLPQLYRDGELARGLLGVAGVALEVLDEDRLSVQRSHWFDRCVERDHAARLAALLDIAPEPWQSLEQFRAWVHAFRDALVERGAVTRPAIQRFVEDYVAAFNAASGAEVIGDVVRWSDSPSPSGPAFVENPPRDRIERTPTTGGIEPLHQFELEHRGLEPSPASFLLVGLPEGPESVPVVVNLTTGRALLVLEQIRPGERLWLRSEGDAVTARLEGRDVSASLRSVAAVVPGQAWAQEDVQTPAHPLVLLPGVNRLWFLPVASCSRSRPATCGKAASMRRPSTGRCSTSIPPSRSTRPGPRPSRPRSTSAFPPVHSCTTPAASTPRGATATTWAARWTARSRGCAPRACAAA